MKSVLETITAGTEYLAKHGVEDARLNMEHLAAHVLECKRIELYMQFDRPLNEAELVPLRELVKRRGGREPLQHILGDVDFLGRIFVSDARALIPRPETEHLVELIRDDLGKTFAGRICDVGCGSGVIGLSLAAELGEDAEVTLVDVSPDALTLTRENAESLELAHRVRLVQGDLLDAVPQGETFAAVLANLPYITTAEMAELQAEVQRDPALALEGGADGLDLVRRLLSQLPARLEQGGLVALELGLGQPQVVADLLLAQGFSKADVIKDHTDRDRFVLARL